MRKVNARAALCWLLAVGLCLGAAAAADPPEGNAYGLVKQELKAYFQDLADAGLLNGAVLVARDGKVLLKEGYGFADAEAMVPNRPDTVFAVASFTKAFTATSILMLEERGLLSVEDPVTWYVPELPYGEHVTIRHLLSQSSGLYEYLLSPDLWANATLDHAPEDLLPYFLGEPLGFEPGSEFAYSNSNYVTLGLIVERVSGMPFRDFLFANVLEPLGLLSTSYDPFEVDFPDKAVGYDDIASDPPVPAMDFNPSIAYAAGAMCSTVEDLYTWEQSFYTEKLLSRATIERMLTPGLGDYGFGWYVDELDVDGEPHKQVWHWGVYFGFYGYVARLVDERVTIIVQQNVSPALGTSDELRPVAADVASIVFAFD